MYDSWTTICVRLFGPRLSWCLPLSPINFSRKSLPLLSSPLLFDGLAPVYSCGEGLRALEVTRVLYLAPDANLPLLPRTGVLLLYMARGALLIPLRHSTHLTILLVLIEALKPVNSVHTSRYVVFLERWTRF